jgi:hypothetical protein
MSNRNIPRIGWIGTLCSPSAPRDSGLVRHLEQIEVIASVSIRSARAACQDHAPVANPGTGPDRRKQAGSGSPVTRIAKRRPLRSEIRACPSVTIPP